MGETVEPVADFIFLDSKITADGDCSHEIKRCLLLGRKVMTNLDSIFGEGSGNPLQYSCLENPMERGAWQATVHGVTKSRTRLSDFTFILMHVNLNIQKTKIMASASITSWQITEETVETVADFIFLGSKITVDGDRSHEIKRRLLLGRKAITNLDSIFKSRDITLPTKVRVVKAMVFPVVMYGCESWTVKKAEH